MLLSPSWIINSIFILYTIPCWSIYSLIVKDHVQGLYGYVDNGVELKIFLLDLKGRFYAIVSLRPKGEILHHARRSVHNGNIYARYFGAYLPQCLELVI